MNITSFLLILAFLVSGPGLNKSASIVSYPIKSREGIEKIFSVFPCSKRCAVLKNGLDPESSRVFSMFRTRIKYAAAQTANFGGKYVICEWGAGTECQAGVIIDLESGVIFELPISCWGREYREDSLLLINNPPVDPPEDPEETFTTPWYAWPSYYLWKEDHFELLFNTSPGRPEEVIKIKKKKNRVFL